MTRISRTWLLAAVFAAGCSCGDKPLPGPQFQAAPRSLDDLPTLSASVVAAEASPSASGQEIRKQALATAGQSLAKLSSSDFTAESSLGMCQTAQAAKHVLAVVSEAEHSLCRLRSLRKSDGSSAVDDYLKDDQPHVVQVSGGLAPAAKIRFRATRQAGILVGFEQHTCSVVGSQARQISFARYALDPLTGSLQVVARSRRLDIDWVASSYVESVGQTTVQATLDSSLRFTSKSAALLSGVTSRQTNVYRSIQFEQFPGHAKVFSLEKTTPNQSAFAYLDEVAGDFQLIDLNGPGSALDYDAAKLSMGDGSARLRDEARYFEGDPVVQQAADSWAGDSTRPVDPAESGPFFAGIPAGPQPRPDPKALVDAVQFSEADGSAWDCAGAPEATLTEGGAGCASLDVGFLNCQEALGAARDQTRPALALTSPADGAVQHQPTAAVSGTVTDESGWVKLTIQGVLSPFASDGRFSAALNLGPGRNVIKVAAEDLAGHVVTETREVFYTPPDIVPPTLLLTSPSENANVASPMVEVAGSAFDPSGSFVEVVIKVGGVEAWRSVPSARVDFSHPVGLADGGNVVTVEAADLAGNTAVEVRHLVRGAFVDATGPQLTVSAPADGTAAGALVEVRGSASDDLGFVKASISVNGAEVWATADFVSGVLTFAQDVPLAYGANQIVVRAEDAAGHFAQATRTVTRPSGDPAPTLELSAPADGLSTRAASVDVIGRADDNGGSVAVVLKVNGVAVGTTGGLVAAPVEFLRAAPLSLGSNTLLVEASDASGNVTSLSRTITREPAPGPVVSFDAPADGQRAPFGYLSVTGSVADVSGAVTVRVLVNGAQIFTTGAADCAANPASCSPVSVNAIAVLARGSNTIAIEARNAAGLSKTVQRTVQAPLRSVQALARGAGAQEVWMGTDLGADRLNLATGAIQHFGKAEGLAADSVVAVAAHPNGDTYFGHGTATCVSGAQRNCGVSVRRANGTFAALPLFKLNAAEYDQVHALALNPAGTQLWVGTYNGVIVYDLGAGTWYSTAYWDWRECLMPGPVHCNQIWSLLATDIEFAADGSSWYALDVQTGGAQTRPGGVAHYALSSTTDTWRMDDGLPSGAARRILLAGDKVWMASQDGAAWFDLTAPIPSTRAFEKVPAPTWPLTPAVNDLAMDSTGKIWLATEQGVRFQDGAGGWTSWTRAEGLPDDQVNALLAVGDRICLGTPIYEGSANLGCRNVASAGWESF